MSVTLKSIFNEQMKHLKIDDHFLHNLKSYQIEFVNKNQEHINFFGSHLMGVSHLRFKPSDRDKWFTDVLQIGELELSDEIKNVTSIDEEWVRASDCMNISCIWIPYALHSSKLQQSKIEAGLIDNFLILQYKFLSSLMAHWFPFNADKEVMEAAYAELSRKYALKEAGSWGKLLYIRAQELASKTSIHHDTFLNFDNDVKIIYAITDIQNRLREIVKSYSTVFYNVRDSGKRISIAKSTITEMDGTTVVKDKTRKYSQYIRYIQTILNDEKSFIKDEIVEVISSAIPTMSVKYLKETLSWIIRNYRLDEKEKIDKFCEDILIHAFNVIFINRSTLSGTKSIAPLLVKLKSLYMASRMSDPILIQNKEIAEGITKQAIKTNNASAIASVRTGLQLYIVTRALAMDYYQS